MERRTLASRIAGPLWVLCCPWRWSLAPLWRGLRAFGCGLAGLVDAALDDIAESMADEAIDSASRRSARPPMPTNPPRGGSGVPAPPPSTTDPGGWS